MQACEYSIVGQQQTGEIKCSSLDIKGRVMKISTANDAEWSSEV